MNNINDIRKNWSTILEGFRSNDTINELDFKDKAAYDAYADKHNVNPNTTVTIDGKKMKAGDVSDDQQGEPAEKEWKRQEGEYTARYPEGDASVEDKVEALTDLWTQYRGTIDTDKRSAIKDKISKYTSWDDSDGGYSYALDLVDDVKSVKDVAKFVVKKEKWLEKRRKEAESGAETGSLSGDFYDNKPNVQGYSIDGYEDASKGQKAVMDIEFQLSQGISNDEAQDIADKIKNFSSADEVYAYYKDERDFSENDAKALATTFAGEPYKGGERAGAVADNPDDFYDVPKTDDKADDKAPDDEWYGDDYQFSDEEDGYGDDDWYGDDDQFDINPDDYASTTRLGDSAEDYIAYDDDQEAYFIDSYDQDDSQVTVEPGDRIQFKNVDGQTVYGTVSDEASGRDDDVYKIDVDTIEESFTNPFENKLLKSIIKGKK